MITIMIADDHAILRHGLEQLLTTTEDMTVTASAADGREIVEKVAADPPDIVLMDLSMPVMDGVEATRAILEAHPEVAVVVLTSFSDQRRVLDALDAGAVGYLLKDSDPDTLLSALRSTAAGGAPLDPKAARVLLSARERPASGVELTPREREVLGLVVRGLSNKLIARELDISERTVKAHLGSVFQRIGVTDRTQAALWAAEHLRERGPLTPAPPT
ncbi:MAG TPA: response regulator transcription factor [Miltoncostaeales bacterium]|jgi:DNA-binding NarL/FixJ family response regulator|nr:response regulator transcription factor [Miltoncostaeales bacterium]